MLVPRPTRLRSTGRLVAAATLAVLAALAVVPAATAQPGNSEPGNYPNQVGPGAYRLDGRDPGLPLDDLAPLRRIVGSADYVGLGEAIHTSGGYYQMRHRMVRYLVEELGFRVLGIESPRSWVEQLEAYAQTCAGTPEQAVNGLFSVFRSTETADLAQYLCEWNQAHPADRVHVYGFDTQRMPAIDAAGLFAFLEQVGAPGTSLWIDDIRVCDGVVDTYWPFLPFPQDLYDRCQGALDEVEDYFDAHEHDLVSATSRDALGWARIYLVSERAWQTQLFFSRTDFVHAYGAREIGMAYSLLAIHELRFPHAKTILWAHNGHLWRDSFPANHLPSMGELLDAALGNRYVVIGQTSRETYVDWPAIGFCGFIDILDANPVEEVFRQVGEEFLLVDLDPRGNHPGLLPAGATYSFEGTYQIVPAHHVDAIVYQEVSPAMNPLAWPPCQ